MHNKKLVGKSFWQARFSRETFLGVKVVEDCSFDRCVLPKHLSKLKFINCEFLQCDFSRSDYTNVTFEKSRIRNANVREAVWIECGLVGSKIHNTSFNRAFIEDLDVMGEGSSFYNCCFKRNPALGVISVRGVFYDCTFSWIKEFTITNLDVTSFIRCAVINTRIQFRGGEDTTLMDKTTRKGLSRGNRQRLSGIVWFSRSFDPEGSY